MDLTQQMKLHILRHCSSSITTLQPLTPSSIYLFYLSSKWYVDAERDTSRNNADRMYKTISHNISSRNIRNSKSVGSYYVQRMHKIQENNQPQPINNNLEQNSGNIYIYIYI